MHVDLVPHPRSLPAAPAFKLWARFEHSGAFGDMATLDIWFGVEAPQTRFVLPASDQPGRTDGLWKSTCFEAFLRPSGEDGYAEFNFAPSGDWAAYSFTGYRAEMEPLELPAEPYLRLEDNLIWWCFGATISLPSDGKWDLGLSAVLEETDGTVSHWALIHPAEQPDFHHPDCFTLQLP